MDVDADHTRPVVPRKQVLVPPAELKRQKLELKAIVLDTKHQKLCVRPVPDTSLYEIRYEGQGRTPLPLQGRYTHRVFAERAIEDYVNGGR